MSSNKNIWDEYSHIWKTQASFFSWLRGGIRRSLWAKSPIKMEFLKKNRVRIKNPNPRGKTATVWGACCALCNNAFPLSQIEVDHKKGNISLNRIEDIQNFIESIVMVRESGLQTVCKPCHKIKNHSERRGVSMDAAKIEKEIIQIMKDKKDKEWLLNRNITPASNATKRRQQIKEEMENGV